MNNFEAKYMKISAEYLDEKLKFLHVYDNKNPKKSSKKSSSIKALMSGLFTKSIKE